MNKLLRIVGIVLLGLIVVAAGLYFTFLLMTREAKLDESKLLSSDKIITIYDADGNEITDASAENRRKSVKLENLNKYTVNAFIASEDRTFYSHRGLNYKRMIKAAYKNIISRSFKEGASTISQQLIKNTHLTGEKTISRKLNEIRLTKKLENKYSKEQILEMYLNTIYFGHNCYGLQSAADFYFGKRAEQLNLNESAVLVGLLSSPNNYSPFKNMQKSVERRNTVLKAMLDCGYIGDNEYRKVISEPVETAEAKRVGYSDYVGAVLDEFDDSGLDFYGLGDNCKIYTELRPEVQKIIENYDYPCDNAVIVTTTDGKVIAYKSTVGSAKRQPGSTIKPLAVYAPAIENKLISPCTKILDEAVDYNGYSPKNNDGKFHGYVTVTESLTQSYNVPAVKTLNSLTVDKAEKYLENSNIKLGDGDRNLSLALGGMQSGVTIKQLADAYSQFASGSFTKSHFISKITTADGKTIFRPETAKTKNFSEGVCSLINDMLTETSKTGTAKKLKTLNFDIASKTGTCGDDGGNTDAYSVNYTSEHCIAVWLGDKDNKKLNITGGRNACPIAKYILENIYKDSSPAPLDKTGGTETIEIDAEDYNTNNKIILADPAGPKIGAIKVKVLSGNVPKEKSTRFSSPTIKQPEISVKNNCVNIKLCQTKYYSYAVKRTKNGKTEVIYDGKWKDIISDLPEEGTYEYSVTPYYTGTTKTYTGKEIVLPSVRIGESKSPQVKVPGIINDEWYNI